MITLTELDEVCDAAAGAMAMTMQQHFPLSRLAHGNKKKRKEKEKKQSSLGLPRWSPTLVLTELDRA